MLRAFVLATVTGLLGGLTTGFGQTPIDSPFDIQLVPRALEGGGYKYGIYAAMAGSSTPQLYELDTGGTGFYAVYSANPTYATEAWGTNYSVVNTNISMGYASDNVYYGNAVSSGVTLYSATQSGTYDLSAKISTPGSVLVGQTLVITNTAGKTTSGSWPSTTPPVDQNFYGDFGLSLSHATNGIMNVLAQMNYSTNVIPGFVVSLGSPDSTNAKIQVGLNKNFDELYPIKIKIQGMDATNLFPAPDGGTNGLPTYSGAVLAAAMVFSNTTSGAFTNGRTDVILDTGASGTLFLTSEAPGAVTNYLSPSGESLGEQVGLSLIVETTDGSFIDLFSAVEGENGFALNVMYRSNFSLNIGQNLFYQYEVAYNLQDGILGLRAIPEANQVYLMAVASLFVIGFALTRTALTRHIRRKRLPAGPERSRRVA